MSSLNWRIEHTDPVEIDCALCEGRGTTPFYDCASCAGSGSDWLDFSRLATLAHNLSIAGALCWSFWLGGYGGYYAWEPGCQRGAK